MIYTVTLNVSLDKIFTLPSLNINTNNRSTDMLLDIGGKATHVSLVLSACNVENIATGFLAGHTGQQVEEMLKDRGVNCNFTWCEQNETRETIILVFEKQEGSYMITEGGFDISKDNFLIFKEKLSTMIDENDTVIFSGGPPPGIDINKYLTLLNVVKSKGAKLIVDVSREYLKEAIKVKPFLIKPNEKEFIDLIGKKPETEKEYVDELLKLNNQGINYVVLSLGKKGSLIAHNQEVYKVTPPKVIEKNDTGCGDVFLGGIIVGMEKDKSIEDILKFASAISASKATKLESSTFDLAQADKYINQVQINKIYKEDFTMLYQKERQELCEVVRIMFDRNMTNATGGNIAVRINDSHIIMTPTLMSQQKFCRLNPDDILVVDKDLNIIEGNGKVTREINMHMAILNNFDNVKCVVHSHPQNSLVYACIGQDMPIYYEALNKVKEVKCLPHAPACSEELAKVVLDYLLSRGNDANEIPTAMLLEKHGVLVTGTSLKATYDILERLETNAFVSLNAEKCSSMSFNA